MDFRLNKYSREAIEDLKSVRWLVPVLRGLRWCWKQQGHFVLQQRRVRMTMSQESSDKTPSEIPVCAWKCEKKTAQQKTDEVSLRCPRSGELRTQKLKSHLVRTQSLNVLPFKPGVGQYIAEHGTLTARDFFLSCLFLHFRSIRLHFFQNLSRFFPVLAVTNTWFLCRPTE